MKENQLLHTFQQSPEDTMQTVKKNYKCQTLVTKSIYWFEPNKVCFRVVNISLLKILFHKTQ